MTTSEALSALNTQIQLANSITGNSEEAKILKHLLANKNLTDQMITEVVNCAATIYIRFWRKSWCVKDQRQERLIIALRKHRFSYT